VLEDPEQRIAEAGGKEIFQSRHAFDDGKMYLLRAIVNTEKQPADGGYSLSDQQD
jgi:hypothetical protein